MIAARRSFAGRFSPPCHSVRVAKGGEQEVLAGGRRKKETGRQAGKVAKFLRVTKIAHRGLSLSLQLAVCSEMEATAGKVKNPSCVGIREFSTQMPRQPYRYFRTAGCRDGVPHFLWTLRFRDQRAASWQGSDYPNVYGSAASCTCHSLQLAVLPGSETPGGELKKLVP